MRNQILMLLPALAYTRIIVNIKVATKNDTSVTFFGADSNIINDTEIKTFKLANLKPAVHSFSGRFPTDVFVKSPTPWGDLYESYNWPQVRTVTKVKRASIANVTEKVILYNQSCGNQSNLAEIICDAKANVSNIAKNNFTGKEIKINAEYIIDIICLDVKLILRLGESNFVKDRFNSQITRKQKITVKPSQIVNYVLNVTKVTVNVTVEYESSLVGYVAVNYYPKFNGHHFYSYDINDIVKSNVHKITDLVTIEYVTNAYAYVIDQSTEKTA